jgi:hypothetical protein
MRRRDFAALLGAAAVFLPHAGNSERRTMRRVGVLLPGAPADSGHFASAFVQELKIAGYVDRENVTLEYRWAEGHNERLPQLAAELVESGIAVIAAGGPQASLRQSLRPRRCPSSPCWGTPTRGLSWSATSIARWQHHRESYVRDRHLGKAPRAVARDDTESLRGRHSHQPQRPG